MMLTTAAADDEEEDAVDACACFGPVEAFCNMITTMESITNEAPNMLNGLMASSGSAMACHMYANTTSHIRMALAGPDFSTCMPTVIETCESRPTVPSSANTTHVRDVKCA